MALSYALAAGTVLAIVLHAGASWQAARARRANALAVGTRHAREMADVVARQMEAIIQGYDWTLLQLREAYLRSLPEEFRVAAQVAVSALAKSGIQGVVVLDELGYVQYSSLGAGQRGVYLGDRGYFQAQATSGVDRLVLGTPAHSRLLASWSFVLARPLNADGRFVGAIILGLAPQAFAERLVDSRLASQDVVAVLHTDGSYLTRSQRLEEVLGRRAPLDRPFFGPSAPPEGVARFASTVDGRPRLYAWRRVEGSEAIVTVGVDEATLLAPVEEEDARALAQGALVAGLLAALGGGLAVLLGRAAAQRARLEESEARYRRAFEERSSLKLLIDPADGRLLDANQAAVDFYGFSREVLLSKRLSELCCHREAEVAAFLAEMAVAGRTALALPQTVASGAVRQIELYAGPIEVEGRMLLFAVLHDFTERDAMVQQLTLHASMFAHTHEGIVYCDPEGRILDLNAAFVRASGYSREEALGKDFRFLDAGHVREASSEAILRVVRRDGFWRGEVWNRSKAGEVFAELLDVSAITDQTGRLTASVAIYSDITSLKESERRFEQLAQRDPLTGLPNRAPLMDRLHQAVRAAAREHELMAVAFLDLDGFKPVNDRYGHRRGDEVLIEVAERLRRTVRAADTVCRVGGDEFVIVLRSLDSADEAATILERIRRELAQPYRANEVCIEGVTASIGFACFPLDAREAETLLTAADEAMYAGKRSGRNQVRRVGG